MLVEWLFVTLLLAGVTAGLLGQRTTPKVRLSALLLVVIALVGGWLWQRRVEGKLDSRARLTVPHVGRPTEYASSVSCRACHPEQYTSWHRSFHRTMTQIASPEAVRGNFEVPPLELDGEVYRLERRGDEFWVELVDPNWKLEQETKTKSGIAPPLPSQTNPQRVWRRISMTTGSHHMQAYWVDNGHGNQQFGFPFAYLFELERWVPRPNAFLKDPKILSLNQIWNVGCVDCHSTAGQPRQKKDTVSFDTRVAELGIACEACHGPAAEHVRLNSDPVRRYALHFEKHGDRSIVNPNRLSAKRSSEICGRCHSVHSPRKEEDWLQNGSSFLPGENLETTMQVLRHPKSFEQRRGAFWSDGMIRVSGREYNGLLKTPCFQKGDMSCLTCHSMHQSSPTNQLSKGMESNLACLQCHPSFEKKLEQHTHHQANSSGSLCYNCHMPYTTYGLLKALRSHQISNPSVQADLQTGRPNSCNLCHLDKTLDWTAQNLFAWYKISPPDLPAEDKSVAASILWALKGDAGQRALIAWHMGWQPARAASGDSWLAPYLATLIDDPYAAVRYIASRSLKRLPAYGSFSYDYIAAGDELHRASARALELWKKTETPPTNTALLLTKGGQLDEGAVQTLLKSRNNRPLDLHE